MRELRSKERKVQGGQAGDKKGSPLLRWMRNEGNNKRDQGGRAGAEQEVKVKKEVEEQERDEEDNTMDKHRGVKNESEEGDGESKEEDDESQEERKEEKKEERKEEGKQEVVIPVKGGNSQDQENADIDADTQQQDDTNDTKTPSPPSSSDDFSDYERRRQENILKNKLLLQQLQLDTVVLGSKKRRRAPSKPTPRKKKDSSVEYVPRRQSSRLAGIPAESETVKRKYDEEIAAYAEAEQAKRKRVSEDTTFDVTGIDFTLKRDRYVRTFTDEDVRNSENQDVKKLREKMMGLKLYERWEPNSELLVASSIFLRLVTNILSLHRTQDYT